MKLNNRMVVFFVAAALIVASSGCATHVGGRAASSVTIDQTFTDTPLRDVLVFIEKATSGPEDNRSAGGAFPERSRSRRRQSRRLRVGI